MTQTAPAVRVHDHIETLAIDDLVPYARNSRTHSAEQVAQIAASIREFGFTNPVLIDDAGGIIAGHGRVLGARAVGLLAVPCLRLAGLSEAQKRAYVIADNKLALNAGWDEDLLREEMEFLNSQNFDLSLTGFNFIEIEALEAELLETKDPDAVPDLPKEPKTQTGDVWVMGQHRLVCGDSTSLSTLDRLMQGGGG
jgi:ParB-like chromosome segregation protein Spo0J